MFDIGRPDDVRKAIQWRTHHIPAGENFQGVVIGTPVCPLVHWVGKRSAPCLRAISNGELLCMCDSEPKDTRRICYIPLLSRELERVVVIVSNGVAHKLGTLEHGQVLFFSRSRVPCAPVSVARQQQISMSGHVIDRAKRIPSQDIREYLLHLWSVDVLTRWCAASERVKDAVADLVEATVAARDTIEVPSPAPVSGATELRARLRRARKSSG